MTRRITRKPTLTLSLFPFLAVLVCTMGALIVLLVCVVQKARVDGAAVVEVEPAKPDTANQERLEQLRVQKEDEDWRRQELETQRAELQKKLVQQRLMLSHFEDHIRELEGKWRDLKQQAAALQTLQANEASAGTEKQLAEATAAVLELQDQLAKAKQEAEGRHRAFAIVPYDGPNGTSRRPIYIECTDAGVILQPEGIVLSPNDFQGSLGTGNPLDASLRTIREYLAKYGEDAGNAEPYPLLIVRPSGTIAYAVARAALKSWDDEFGYELIDEEMTLAYPQPDPSLKQLVEKSIADARQRQAILAAMMPGRFKTVSSSGIVATTNGGFAPAGGGGGAGYATGSRMPNGGGGTGDGGSFSEAFQESLGVGRDGVLTIAGAQNGASGTGIAGFGSGGGGRGTPGSPPSASQGGVASSGTGTGATGTGATGAAATSYGANGQAGGASGPVRFGPPNAGSGSPNSGNMASFPTAGGSGSQEHGDPSASPAANTRSTSGAQRGSSTAQDGKGKPDPKAKPVSRYRGPEWGLPNRGPNTTGIQRTITVQCDPGQLVLLPEKGDYRGPLVVPTAEGVAPALEGFVGATWKRMETWGIAGDGCYWKPVLRVQVAPGAEGQFQELTRLLEGSGLTVERKP